MNIVIDTDSPLAVYRQIKNQIKGLVASGQIDEGAQLPSIRDLASFLNVAVNTVARAYYELESDGIVKLDGRRGTVVTGFAETDSKDAERFLLKLTEEYLLRTKEYPCSLKEIEDAVRRKYEEIY